MKILATIHWTWGSVSKLTFPTDFTPSRRDLIALLQKTIAGTDKDIKHIEFDIVTAVVARTLLEQLETLRAYPDTKCQYGYMVLCDDCKRSAPYWVNTITPIDNPPTIGAKQQCEICKCDGTLKGGKE